MSSDDICVIEEVKEQLESKHYYYEQAYEYADTDTLKYKILELIEEDEEIQEKIIETVKNKEYSLFARIVGAIVEYWTGRIGGELAQDVAEWVWHGLDHILHQLQ